MKILHVINKLSFEGGPTITVPRLCDELRKQGHEVEVWSTGRVLLQDWIQWADVVHLTGIYNRTTFPTLLRCRQYKKALVWSPRGGWQRYDGSRKVLLKRWWDALCRRLAPPHTVIHATSELEAQSIVPVMPRPIRVIANGVDVPETLLEKEPHEGLRVLYLGRIDRKKGIEKVLAAIAVMHPDMGITLKIVGDGDPLYVDTLKRIAKHFPHIRFCGHVEHTRLPLVFQQTDVTVVPSEIESFGQVVVESLAHGVPVMASTGVPFILHEHGCGVSVDMTNPPIEHIIGFHVLKHQYPWILQAMGEAGRDWMVNEYRWEDKAREMVEVYKWVGELNQERPEFSSSLL